MKKILAVASAGGHWVQLQRLTPAFEGNEVRYISTNPLLEKSVPNHRFYSVRDASMWDKFGLLCMAFQTAWIIAKYRPNVIISTGAAPGFFALLFGSIIGSKTIWLDSIANSEELSLAGQKVKRWANVWLTQWPELACEKEGPKFVGSVI